MMGEYAEMMLDGTCCSSCGEFINYEGGDGFPVQCASCAPPERDTRPKLKWYRVRKKSGIDGVAGFVRRRHVNTYSGPRSDKNGNPFFLLGWDDKPDSDWGRFKGNTAAIWCQTDELAALTEIEIRKGLGWGQP